MTLCRPTSFLQAGSSAWFSQVESLAGATVWTANTTSNFSCVCAWAFPCALSSPFCVARFRSSSWPFGATRLLAMTSTFCHASRQGQLRLPFVVSLILLAYINNSRAEAKLDWHVAGLVVSVRGKTRRAVQIPCTTSAAAGTRNLFVVAIFRKNKNQAIVATESGNHDRGGHAHRAGPTENGVHHRYGYAVLWRVLDFRKRQHRQITNVRQNTKYDHNRAPADSARTRFFRDRALRCR